jgi:hypothetical protein
VTIAQNSRDGTLDPADSLARHADETLLVSRICLQAVLPVLKVLLAEDPKMTRRFADVNAVVQFRAKHDSDTLGAHLRFADGQCDIVQQLVERPDLEFRFGNAARMNAMFAGKPVLLSIRGWWRLGLLWKVLLLLLRMKLLLPQRSPRNQLEARLKVKMTLYMATSALSQLNKAGDPEMGKWVAKQPERVYQWSVQNEEIACYLKVKYGKSKAGRGYYTRRTPFVHTRFRSVDDAVTLLANEIDTVAAMREGLVSVEGSPEYGGQASDFMLRIGKMLCE